jgi:selenide, water dikinase
MKNPEKRKRVMQRSVRLGHCICDPKKPCPCDVFTRSDVCLCAGERLEKPDGPVRLTELVENVGCASKIDQAALKGILGKLPGTTDPKVLVGVAAGDDAGVYALSDDLALVETVDVFCPSVDDPYLFGQIAAANSVSDVYAMGGKPITALSILGFPIRTVSDQVMLDILRGGLDKMAEAGVSVVGGHSINDKEIKAGFAVTGVINPKKIMANAGARPGDVLVLTKPIGTGIIAFAAQIGRAPAGSVDAIAASMASLNKNASELMIEYGAHACTDITGFGLVGHLAEMARSSGVDVSVVWDDVPLFPGVLECAGQGILPGAIERNRESSEENAVAAGGLTREMLDILFDAQTSGGLLVALPEKRADAFLKRLRESGAPAAAVIGTVKAKGSGKVFIETTGRRAIPPAANTESSLPAAGAPAGATACCADEASPAPPAVDCCAGGATAARMAVSDVPQAPPGAAERAFKDFMKHANAPGALDAATKQALAIALSVVTKCEPCTKTHIKKARQMGFTQEEIDEAAWMAIAFGGSPVMMFYNGLRDTR